MFSPKPIHWIIYDSPIYMILVFPEMGVPPFHYKSTSVFGVPHHDYGFTMFHLHASAIFWAARAPKRVCLKIGYIPNYSHLIGIMIITVTIGFRGTLFSDKPKRLGFANGFWKKIHWTSRRRPSQPMWRSWCGKRAPPKTLGLAWGPPG